jgi:hypothetical protein
MIFRTAVILLSLTVGVVFLLGVVAALQYPRAGAAPQAGIGPASPWYPFELLGERVVFLLFSRQPRVQARLAAHFAEERLRELEELVRRSAAPRLVRRAQQRVAEAWQQAWQALLALPAVSKQKRLVREAVQRLRQQIIATRERAEKAEHALAAARVWLKQTRELEKSLRAVLESSKD